MPAPAPQARAEAPAAAGFWLRYAAWSLDAACLLPLVALLGMARTSRALADARDALQELARELPRLLGEALDAPQPLLELARRMLLDPAMAAAMARVELSVGAVLATPVLLYALLALPWAVLFEQSQWQATPGKRALGLVVTDAHGRRLKAGHALVRHLAAGLSWLTLNAGHALVLLPPKQLALHDRISDTRVHRATASPRLPWWARAWLALQAIALVAAVAWLYAWLQAAMQAAIEQVLGL